MTPYDAQESWDDTAEAKGRPTLADIARRIAHAQELTDRSTVAAHAEPRSLRWVSCSFFASPSVARERHLIIKRTGADTTLCGATGLPPGVWRGNRSKAPCATCLQEAGARGLRLP